MGVTTHSNNLVQKHKGNAKTMLELGSQNTYFDCEPMGVAKDYYTKQGFEHCSLDANGEYDSEIVDLATVLNLEPCDIVTDFGTSEHVSNYYNCWLNKHNGCKVGGLIISENPKVNNWHGHGFHYLTKEFYIELCKVAGYELIEVGEHAAMGNVTDGWNVYGVLRKVSDAFPSESDFYTLPFESAMVRNTAGGGNYTTEVTNIEDLTGNDAMGFESKAMAVAPETDSIKTLRVKLQTLNNEYMALPKDSERATDLKAQVKAVTDKLRSLEYEIGSFTSGKAAHENANKTAPKKRGRPSKK